jgi:hypothetical protein
VNLLYGRVQRRVLDVETFGLRNAEELCLPSLDDVRTACVGIQGGSRAERLRGLVSQSAVLWDTVRLRVRRVAKGHTRISLLPEPTQEQSAEHVGVQSL